MSKFNPTLSKEDSQDNAYILKSLADPTRLIILSILMKHEGNVCVYEIVQETDKEQPTVSHHLGILLKCRIVSRVKKGNNAYYYINRDALKMTLEDMITRLV